MTTSISLHSNVFTNDLVRSTFDSVPASTSISQSNYSMEAASLSPSGSVSLSLSPLNLIKSLIFLLRAPKAISSFAIVLIVCQMLDGIFTAAGMYRFGIGMEANIFLRESMLLIGIIPTLMIAKGGAIGIVLALKALSREVKWIGESLAVLSVLYLSAAVIPWSIILTSMW